MIDIFIRMVLGHLVGDYLLQSKNMAIKKGYSTWICFIHCFIYTLSICLFIWKWNLFIICLIFLSHYPIDRYCLALYWLRLIRGRNYLEEYNNRNIEYRDLSLPFSCFVYAVTDNTIHIILLWLISFLV
jgi:hypothetical protein